MENSTKANEINTRTRSSVGSEHRISKRANADAVVGNPNESAIDEADQSSQTRLTVAELQPAVQPRKRSKSFAIDARESRFGGGVAWGPKPRRSCGLILGRGWSHHLYRFQVPPSEKTYVYLLLLKRKVQYIGVTRDLAMRVGCHRKDGKKFDDVLYLVVKPCDDPFSIEAALIYEYDPPLNRKGSPTYERSRSIRPLASEGGDR